MSLYIPARMRNKTKSMNYSYKKQMIYGTNLQLEVKVKRQKKILVLIKQNLSQLAIKEIQTKYSHKQQLLRRKVPSLKTNQIKPALVNPSRVIHRVI
jgi:hypothetical protein